MLLPLLLMTDDRDCRIEIDEGDIMKVNEGTVDRIVRVIVGLALLIVALLSLQGAVAWIVGTVGVMLLITAASGVCGLYALLKISTVKTRQT